MEVFSSKNGRPYSFVTGTYKDEWVIKEKYPTSKEELANSIKTALEQEFPDHSVEMCPSYESRRFSFDELFDKVFILVLLALGLLSVFFFDVGSFAKVPEISNESEEEFNKTLGELQQINKTLQSQIKHNYYLVIYADMLSADGDQETKTRAEDYIKFICLKKGIKVNFTNLPKLDGKYFKVSRMEMSKEAYEIVQVELFAHYWEIKDATNTDFSKYIAIRPITEEEIEELKP